MRTARLLPVLLALAACEASIDSAPSDESDELAPTGRHYHYVVNQLHFAATSAEAGSIAFDLDGDGRPDNTLGYAIAAMHDQGVDFEGLLNAQIHQGTMLLLGSMRANRLSSDDSVSWQGFVAVPDPGAVLDGTGVFTVSTSTPRDAVVDGVIKGSVFLGGPGVALLALPGGGSLHLYKAHMTASCATKGCGNGRIGGVITVLDRDRVILPLVAAMLDYKVTSDGCADDPVPATCTSGDKATLQIFDTNGDRHISTDEVVNSSLVQAILAPDIDLDGDGVRDGISLAFGFTAAHATFKAPE